MRKYKQFFIGFLVGSMIFSGISIFAEVNPITAFTSNIQIFINGTKLETEPINYNDSTYIPLRAVAEALNKSVTYHEETNSVDINDKFVSTVSTPAPVTVVTATEPVQATEDIEIHVIGGGKFVSFSDVDAQLSKIDYDLKDTMQSTHTAMIVGNDKIMLNDIPFCTISGYVYIDYGYYVDEILPLLQ